MTDIDALKDVVIEATRKFLAFRDHDTLGEITNALQDLDTALEPDPWQLLEDAMVVMDPDSPEWEAARDALKWKENNP